MLPLRPRPAAALAAAVLLAGCAAASGGSPALTVAPVASYHLPVEYHTLDNGLRVVLSRDATAPRAVVATFYHIGFRSEPRGRTGFAHLFEHLMFQGSENLPRGEFPRLVQRSGGVLNGSTRFDYTSFFEVVPSHALETVLWAEADRMRSLRITPEALASEQGVVKNEVRVNVLNRPFGAFPWLDLPQHANTNWHNAHNFYGDLADLDAATMDDVRRFFATYYVPNNAVLVVVGDFDSAATLAWVRRYFGDIPRAPDPVRPDASEPRQTEERRVVRRDPRNPRPALAVGYHAPPPGTPEYFAMGLLNQILVQGRDSRLHRALVRDRRVAGEVAGGINLPGNLFDNLGPTLLTAYVVHDPAVSPDSIVRGIDEAVEALRARPVEQAVLDQAVVKMRSDLYSQLEGLSGFGRADLLASLTLLHDDPARINRLEEQFRQVTPELLHRTAREYLRPTNRTILIVEPQPAAAAGREE